MARPYIGGRKAALVRQRRKALADSDITDLVYKWGRYTDGRPRPRNRERWLSCKRDLAAFLKTYMPRAFPLDWSEDHHVAIDRLQHSILHGGQNAIAMPRGNGKTTICEGAVKWAIAYGHRKFVVIIGATKEAADGILANIKREIEDNPLLAEDFPGMAVPVSAMDGKPIKGKSLLIDNRLARVSMKADQICFASIKCDSSGAVVKTLALTGGLRGLNRKMPDGSVARPDFVFLDDPQTDESAASPTQTDTREKLVNGAILGLAGPDVKIAAVMACTVIEEGDLSDRVLNKPEWRPVRTSLVLDWPHAGLPDERPDPKNGRPGSMLLWAEYARIRREALRAGDDGEPATEYYRQNREAMDAGARLSWPERYNAGQLSGLQYAMDIYIDRGAETFFAEYQNDPASSRQKKVYTLTQTRVQGNLSGLEQRTTPDDALFVCTFADINHYGLHWTTIATAGDMTGAVVDYGRYPERGYLVPKGASRTEIAKLVFGGLVTLGRALADFRLNRPTTRETIDLLLIDAGYETDTVFRYLRSPDAQRLPFRVEASRGYAAQKFRESRSVATPRDHCHLAKIKRGQWIEHDSDWWRKQTQEAFLVDPGGPGALSLWGTDPDAHERYARHITAEYLAEFAEHQVCDHYVWRHVPGSIWDWLDSTVGAWMGCCMLGGSFSALAGPPPKAQQKKAARRKAKVARQ